MERKEKIFKICCMIMCWAPLGVMIISNEMELSQKMQNGLWRGVFLIDIVLALLSFKIDKHQTKRHKIMGAVGLAAFVAYYIYGW